VKKHLVLLHEQQFQAKLMEDIEQNRENMIEGSPDSQSSSQGEVSVRDIP